MQKYEKNAHFTSFLVTKHAVNSKYEGTSTNNYT